MPRIASRPCVAPRNDSAASCSPLSTSSSDPVSARTRPAKASAVRGVADRGGRGHPDRARVERSRAARVAPEDVERPFERVGRDRAGPVDVLPEPRDHHVARELLEPLVPGLGDEQPGRVRSLVDRGEPTVALGVDRLDPFRDPGAHDVVTSGEVVRVVRVQALHARPRPADAAERPRPPDAPRARSRAYSSCARADRGGERPDRPPHALVQLDRSTPRPRAWTRLGPHRDMSARTASGTASRPASNGAFRMTSGCPAPHRATTVNGIAGSRPSCVGDDVQVAPAEFAHAGRYLRLCSIGRA